MHLALLTTAIACPAAGFIFYTSRHADVREKKDLPVAAPLMTEEDLDE